MKEFKAEVELFKEETPLRPFAIAEKIQDSVIPKDFGVLISHHNFSEDMPLKEIERIRLALKKEYRFEDCALMLHDVLAGSIKIVWLVPKSVTQHVLKVTSTIERDAFREIGLVELEYNGKSIYNNDLASEVRVHVCTHVEIAYECEFPEMLYTLLLEGA